MLALCFVLITTLSCVKKETPKHPNVIYIMADDMGYFDIGCYGSDIQTPNIDRMAQEGLLLTDFYSAAPNCSPARAGLLKGLGSPILRRPSILKSDSSGGSVMRTLVLQESDQALIRV